MSGATPIEWMMREGFSMIEERSSGRNHRSSMVNRQSHGYTLVEVITVALVISILACVAVPRLSLSAVWGARADAAVQRLVTDLRHTRVLAITHAARNPEGFALVVRDAHPGGSYQIINRHDRTMMTSATLPEGVQCEGGRRFEFGPLGNLQNGSDRHLRIRTEGRAYRIEIAPATGAVEWYRGSDNQ
jgi:prepilin-type N-terminal cleavage/methylation domain-containing protein